MLLIGFFVDLVLQGRQALAMVSWSTVLVVHSHVAASTILRRHKDCGIATLKARSMIMQFCPLWAEGRVGAGTKNHHGTRQPSVVLCGAGPIAASRRPSVKSWTTPHEEVARGKRKTFGSSRVRGAAHYSVVASFCWTSAVLCTSCLLKPKRIPQCRFQVSRDQRTKLLEACLCDTRA